MSTLLRRDPRTMFPDLVEWFEEPFLTLRPYLGQPIRIEDFVEGDHYLIRAELAGIDPEKDVEVTVGSGYLTIRAERHDMTEGKHRRERQGITIGRRQLFARKVFSLRRVFEIMSPASRLWPRKALSVSPKAVRTAWWRLGIWHEVGRDTAPLFDVQLVRCFPATPGLLAADVASGEGTPASEGKWPG